MCAEQKEEIDNNNNVKKTKKDESEELYRFPIDWTLNDNRPESINPVDPMKIDFYSMNIQTHKKNPNQQQQKIHYLFWFDCSFLIPSFLLMLGLCCNLQLVNALLA